MLNTLIRVGRFNDPRSEEMLSKFLIERRDAILRRYLPAVNPVVDVRLSSSGTLDVPERGGGCRRGIRARRVCRGLATVRQRDRHSGDP